MNCFAFSRPKIWKINGQVQSLVFALHVCLLGPPTLIFSWQCHSSSKLLHKQHFRAGSCFLLYFGLSPSLFLPLRLSASGQAPSSHDLSPFLTLSKPIGSGWHHCNTQMWQLGGGGGVLCAESWQHGEFRNKPLQPSFLCDFFIFLFNYRPQAGHTTLIRLWSMLRS